MTIHLLAQAATAAQNGWLTPQLIAEALGVLFMLGGIWKWQGHIEEWKEAVKADTLARDSRYQKDLAEFKADVADFKQVVTDHMDRAAEEVGEIKIAVQSIDKAMAIQAETAKAMAAQLERHDREIRKHGDLTRLVQLECARNHAKQYHIREDSEG